MKKQSTTKYSSGPLKLLEALRKRYNSANLGYRNQVRELIAEAAEIGYALQSEEKHLDAFKRKKFWNGVHPPKNTIHAAMMYMANARSQQAYQLAASRARCAEYLHQHQEVSFADMPREIALRGGYKKIAEEAAKMDPRQVRQKASPSKPAAVKFTFDEKRLKRIEKYEIGQQVQIYATLIDKSRSLFEVTKLIKSESV
ncbi:hypothetical protein [Aquabacter cavernae]|uniref:hypothetical protein n=1 Tax=Aquabacter cavernae TaxID=2496029 RepID=UPI000F8CFD09|nr:hypothetical protein [Aquabacter cavernae]